MSDSFLGSKAGAGVWQTIVNRIPPHDCLIIPFAGHCAVSRHIRGCERLILCDLDPEVCDWWHGRLPPHGEIHCCDGIEFLRHHFMLTAAGVADKCDGIRTQSRVLGFPRSRVVIYSDSPYHHQTRTSAARYRHEMTHDDHVRYLEVATRMPSPMLISGYRHEHYDAALSDWARTDFQAMTRGGVRTESLWQNFEPGDLHDWRFYGKDKREREKLKRREQSVIGKLRSMPHPERQRLIAALADEFSDARGTLQPATGAPVARSTDAGCRDWARATFP